MRYFLWLLPEPKTAIYWNGVIHRLAKIYNQIPHMAHVTLESWPTLPQLDFLDEKVTNAVTLEIGQPKIGRPPWQRLYVSVGPKERLNAFNWIEKTRQNNAHLSLLYGEHSLGRCIDLQRNLHLPADPILFSQLSLIQGSNDVAHWIELKRWSLKTDNQ
ncbi:MAG: hypothetical protein VXZ96_06790 [Myxococcota bacterium]|nr:hypothetical protein [Myxococcota bacterium]